VRELEEIAQVALRSSEGLFQIPRLSIEKNRQHLERGAIRRRGAPGVPPCFELSAAIGAERHEVLPARVDKSMDRKLPGRHRVEQVSGDVDIGHRSSQDFVDREYMPRIDRCARVKTKKEGASQHPRESGRSFGSARRIEAWAEISVVAVLRVPSRVLVGAEAQEVKGRVPES